MTDRSPESEFSRAFLRDVVLRVGLGIAVLVVAGACGQLARNAGGQTAGFWAAVLALFAGAFVAVLAYRRLSRLPDRSRPAAPDR